MRSRLISSLVALAAILSSGQAMAQALSCKVPERLPRPRPDLPTADQPQRILPIGGYTLALTWSPGFCRANGRGSDNRFECAGRNKFGFTLHGLWPDGVGKEWPQYCKRTALVSERVVRENICATPSVQLIQHEWAKHGTCMPVNATEYFRQARGLYDAVRYPDMLALSRRTLTVRQFKAEMARANPAIPAGAMKVRVTRQGWLDEVWLCLDRRMRYTRCKPNSGGSPDAAQLKIWRGGGRA